MEHGSVLSIGAGDVPGNDDEEEAVETVRGKSSVNGATSHRRSLSGSILSKLSFLRSNTADDEAGPQLRQTNSSDEFKAAMRGRGGGAMAMVQQQKKTRKRRGSLRKTALLGTGRLRLEGRERRGSNLEQVKSLYNGPEPDVYKPSRSDSSDPISSKVSPRPQENVHPSTSSRTETQFQNGHLYAQRQAMRHAEYQSFVSPATSPSGDTSTTDEDDMITFPRVSSSATAVPPLKQPSSSGSDSYFPPQSSLPQRRRSSNKPKSPLGTLSEATVAGEEWDYSDTEWWGWVVLVVTWIVFVVGMGSCLGVWSWAWDVGETPYAPPELEDDPTLPIVGYYPALMILTAVMAWVWVVVAWVGMKYFRHAKISGEDI